MRPLDEKKQIGRKSMIENLKNLFYCSLYLVVVVSFVVGLKVLIEICHQKKFWIEKVHQIEKTKWRT